MPTQPPYRPLVDRRRPVYTRTCIACGQRFTTTLPGRGYCVTCY